MKIPILQTMTKFRSPKQKKNNWKFHHQLIEIAKLLSISKYIEQIGFDLIDKCIHA